MGITTTALITAGMVITVIIIMAVTNRPITMMTFITHIHITAGISGVIILQYQSVLAGAGAAGTTILTIMDTGAAGTTPHGTIHHTITTTRTHIVVMVTIMDTVTPLIITIHIQKDREICQGSGTLMV